MKIQRALLAGFLATTLQTAVAAPENVVLSHVSLSNFGNVGTTDLSDVTVASDDGRVAVLNLQWLGGTTLEQTDSNGRYASYHLMADFTPAEGYAVRSIKLSGLLDVERVNQPQQFDRYNNWLGYSQYILGDGFGNGFFYAPAPAGDTLQTAMVRFTDPEYIDSSKPFYAELATKAEILDYNPVSGPTPYASITWRDVTVTIEMVPVSSIPEPGTWAMLLAGMLAVGVAARQRKH